jgi:predicted regulator of Ras-like GTPase activity (Roadblock/LC7/MglB family)
MPIAYRSDALLASLASLHRDAPEIRGSAILTHDGLVIASYPPGWEGDIHAPAGGENVSAMAAVVVGLAEKTLARLEQGALEQVLMAGERGTVAVFPATADSALALLIAKDAKLGLILHAAARAAEQIRAIIDNR